MSKSRKEPKNFKQKVQNRISELKINKELNGSIVEWTTWALDQGIELDYEFIKLNRGLKAIEILLADAQSPMTFELIAKKLAFQNKSYVTRLLMNEKDLKLKDFSSLIGIALPTSTASKKMKISCESLF